MTFVEIKTSELIGGALDWAVGRAEGLDVRNTKRSVWVRGTVPATGLRVCDDYWMPSTTWEQGGPLIDKHIAELAFTYGGPGFYARHRHKSCDGDQQHGETALIATCRAIVFAKLGDTVSVPAELIQ